MQHHLPRPLRQPAALAVLAATLLAACSGGGGDAPPAAPTPATATTATLSGRAVDGPLRGAIACLDLDDDGACGSTEPRSAPSAADGSFRIEVPLAEAGRHAVVVEVPADAVDADTGRAVPRAFTMRAPASGRAGSHAVFVSPLTTLVAAHMAEQGVTLEQATAFVQAQGALALSPLADFTLADDAAARQAARLARLVQLTSHAQLAALAGVAGTPDIGGSRLAAADIEREAGVNLLAALPALAGALTDPAMDAASGATLEALLQVQARSLAAAAGPSAQDLRAVASVRRLAAVAPPAVGEPSASLTALRYAGPDDWTMRTLQASADDTLPDAQGYQRYYDVRQQSTPNGVDGAGVTHAWSSGNTRARAGDLHWNGTQWVGCALNDRFLTRVRDAQGRGDYLYCDGSEAGSGIRRIVDISGQDMATTVVERIRSFPGGSAGVSYRNWGPSDLNLLQGGSFPEGSRLTYQSNTVTATAFTYDTQASNVVLAFNAAVAAGGDARVSPALACNDAQQTSVAAQAQVPTLETLVARNRGTPCIYNPGGVAPNVTGATNQWWGNSTVNMGDLTGVNTLPAGTGNYYNTTASLRVGFAATGNGALFYRCFRRAADNSPRNCSLMGLGRWSIQTLGDARVLSFSVMPALAQRLSYARVFVERGGKVYYGFKNPVGEVTTQPRLNMVAANALAFQLGLPRLRPINKPGSATGARAAALVSLKGAWGDFDPDGNGATVFRFGDDGRFFMAEASLPRPQAHEQTGAELGWFDYDPATQQFSTLLEVDSNLTAGTSHPSPADMTMQLTITPNQISTSAGDALPRLETSVAVNSLVGLWAVDSATDLSVTQLVFFSNGRFMLIHHKGGQGPGECIAGGDGQCPPGVEFGEYSFDPLTGRIRLLNLLYDTNGCIGAFRNCPAAVAAGTVNTEATFVVTMAADGKTFTLVDEASQLRTYFRIPSR